MEGQEKMTLVLDNTVMSNFALVRGFRFVTDDRLARREARRLGIPLTGTLGLLRSLVDDQVITFEEANSVLQQMIRHGYRCPVQSL